MDNYLCVDQISYLQAKGDGNGGKQYDVEEGQKSLSSVYYEVGNGKVVSKNYIAEKAYMETLAEAFYNTTIKTIATNTIDLLNGVDGNGDKVQYKIITYYNHNSKTYYARFIYHEFTNYDGTRQAIWLFNTQEDTLEKLGK
jgi:hypothetical protein